jgi:hypothetical protein
MCAPALRECEVTLLLVQEQPADDLPYPAIGCYVTKGNGTYAEPHHPQIMNVKNVIDGAADTFLRRK